MNVHPHRTTIGSRFFPTRREGNSADQPTVGPLAVCTRLVQVGGVLGRNTLRLCWSSGHALAARRSLADARNAWLVNTITDLGPAFIKVAQMMSTRPDLVPPKMCEALAGLYDDVRPIPTADLLPLLEQRLGQTFARTIGQRAAPIASGSIACVYRGTLPDGRTVAVKVRRPGIQRVLAVDLAIMRYVARLLTRTPTLRGVPVVEIMTQLSESVYRQLDLARECDSLERLRHNLKDFPEVRVPQVYRDLCDEDIVVMEFVDDLRRLRPADLTEECRRQAVISALRATYQMLFKDGLVHCDLHPGNLYLRQDGSVVIVDAGFTVALRPQAQDKFASFFHQMTKGNGQRCAEIVLSTATPGSTTDTEGFCRELRTLVERNTGARAADFDLVGFATQLFDIQRRYGLYADPQFVFPILSLLVLEGTVRDFAPDIDFQNEAVPFLVQGTLERAVRAWQATLVEEEQKGHDTSLATDVN